MHLFHDWWAPLQFCSHHCQVGHSIVEHGMSQAPNKYQKSLSREKLLVESQHRSLADQLPLVPMAGDRNQQSCTGCHSVTFPSTAPPPPGPATGGGTACPSHALNSRGELEARVPGCVFGNRNTARRTARTSWGGVSASFYDTGSTHTLPQTKYFLIYRSFLVSGVSAGPLQGYLLHCKGVSPSRNTSQH